MERVDPAHDLRKSLRVRLALAAGVLVTGLVALAWLGDSPPDATPPVSGSLVASEPAAPAEVAVPPRIAAELVGSSAASVAQGLVGATTPAPTEDAARKVTEASPVAAAAVPERAADATDAGPAAERSKQAQAAAPLQNKPRRGPHLQAGVFIQATNAEELKAKLEAEGLPVYIESRVQIGPFKNRKEAEHMREKLKAQGLTTVLIPQ